MSKKSTCTYRRVATTADEYWGYLGQRRANIYSIMSKVKVRKDVFQNFIKYAIANDMSYSMAFEQKLLSTLKSKREPVICDSNELCIFPNITILPQYIEMLKDYKESERISWSEVFEAVICNID